MLSVGTQWSWSSTGIAAVVIAITHIIRKVIVHAVSRDHWGGRIFEGE